MKRYSQMIIGAALILTVTAIAGAEMKDISLPKDAREFIHVKSMVIPDKSHGLYGFHHIYVNEKGLKTLKKGGVYPEKTIFTGEFYDVVTEKDGSITQGKKLYTVYMKKDAKAKETGGWKFAVFDPDGKFLEKDYKKECFEC